MFESNPAFILLGDFDQFKGRIIKIGSTYLVKGNYYRMLFGIDNGVSFCDIAFNDGTDQLVIPIIDPDPLFLLRFCR